MFGMGIVAKIPKIPSTGSNMAVIAGYAGMYVYMYIYTHISIHRDKDEEKRKEKQMKEGKMDREGKG